MAESVGDARLSGVVGRYLINCFIADKDVLVAESLNEKGMALGSGFCSLHYCGYEYRIGCSTPTGDVVGRRRVESRLGGEPPLTREDPSFGFRGGSSGSRSPVRVWHLCENLKSQVCKPVVPVE